MNSLSHSVGLKFSEIILATPTSSAPPFLQHILQAGWVVGGGFCDWVGSRFLFLWPPEYLLAPNRLACRSEGFMKAPAWPLCIYWAVWMLSSAMCPPYTQFLESNSLLLHQPGLFGDLHGSPLTNNLTKCNPGPPLAAFKYLKIFKKVFHKVFVYLLISIIIPISPLHGSMKQNFETTSFKYKLQKK